MTTLEKRIKKLLAKGILADFPVKISVTIVEMICTVRVYANANDIRVTSFDLNDPQGISKARGWFRNTYRGLRTLHVERSVD